jgi:predicted PurR-regulated permease PerM
MQHQLSITTAPEDSQNPIKEIPADILPLDLKTVYLGGLFIFALLTALYFTSEIAMPVVLAFVLKLVLQPLLRFLHKLRLPRILSSIIIIAALVSGLIGLGTALSSPLTRWAEKISESAPILQNRLGFLSHTITEAQKFMVNADAFTKGAGPKVLPVAIQGTRLSDKIFTGTKALIGGLFTTLLILFFLLISGDTFLRRLVEVLPRFKDKRQVVDISQQIEQDISGYLLTVTMMNILVGVSTGLAVNFFGLEDPLLWGTLAFLLNYIPIIGPLIGIAVLLLAGLMTSMDGGAVLPASIYLIIHILEGTMITPLLLARRFTLNPVLVILSLVFWYWMWGAAGAILSMPILAITKIICDRIGPLMPLGHFLEG